MDLWMLLLCCVCCCCSAQEHADLHTRLPRSLAGQRAVWHMIRTATGLRSLDMSGNRLSVPVVKSLVTALMSNAGRGLFTELDLSETGLTDKGDVCGTCSVARCSVCKLTPL